MNEEPEDSVYQTICQYLDFVDTWRAREFSFSDNDSDYVLRFVELTCESKKPESYSEVLKGIASGLRKTVEQKRLSREERVYIDFARNRGLKDAIRVLRACGYDVAYYQCDPEKIRTAKHVVTEYRQRVGTLLGRLDRRNIDEVKRFLQEYAADKE